MTGLVDSPPHVEVAAYVLGILNQEDSEAFDRHLPDCRSCQQELLEMYELPDALDLIKRGMKGTVNGAVRGTANGAEYGVNGRSLTSVNGVVPDGVVRDLWSPQTQTQPPRRASGSGHRRAPTREKRYEVPLDVDEVAVARDRRRRNVLLAAAAAVIIGVTGTLATELWQRTGTGNVVAAPGITAEGKNSKTGVSGSVDMISKAWGTEVAFKLSGVTGPERCSLVAISRTGDTDIVSGWRVPDGSGFGVPGHAEPLQLTGATALSNKEIVRFEVRRDDGVHLLDIPIA